VTPPADPPQTADGGEAGGERTVKFNSSLPLPGTRGGATRADPDAELTLRLPSDQLPDRGRGASRAPDPFASITDEQVGGEFDAQGPTHELPSGSGTGTRDFPHVLAGPDQDTQVGAPGLSDGEPEQVGATYKFQGVLPIPRGSKPASGAVARGQASNESLEPGATLGGFTLGAPLRSSRCATAHQATHPVLPASAVLALTPDRAACYGSKFLLEARLRTTLDHPALARVYAVGSEPRPWVAVEWVRGPTLAERLEDGPLPIQDAVRLVAQVARGLACAHGQGVLHGDLRPQDVVLEEGDVARPRLVGFGVGKALNAFGHRLAWPGEQLGAAPHAAPEQFLRKPLTPRSEVYALGALLFHTLQGQPPFSGDSAHDVMHEVTTATQPALDPDVPPPVAEVVQRCLERSPDARYEGPLAVAEALDGALAPAGTGTLVIAAVIVLMIAVAAALAFLLN
jgi:serine/threonine protein kinase